MLTSMLAQNAHVCYIMTKVSLYTILSSSECLGEDLTQQYCTEETCFT